MDNLYLVFTYRCFAPDSRGPPTWRSHYSVLSNRCFLYRAVRCLPGVGGEIQWSWEQLKMLILCSGYDEVCLLSSDAKCGSASTISDKVGRAKTWLALLPRMPPLQLLEQHRAHIRKAQYEGNANGGLIAAHAQLVAPVTPANCKIKGWPFVLDLMRRSLMIQLYCVT